MRLAIVEGDLSAQQDGAALPRQLLRLFQAETAIARDKNAEKSPLNLPVLNFRVLIFFSSNFICRHPVSGGKPSVSPAPDQNVTPYERPAAWTPHHLHYVVSPPLQVK